MINLLLRVNTSELDYLISELSNYNPLEDDRVIKALCQRGVELLKDEAANASYKFSPGDDIVSGMEFEIESNNRGVVYNRNPKMAFIEFGTGVVGRNSNQNPLAESIGWVYDQNNHGEAGWWYPVKGKPPDGQPSWYKDGQWYAWTRGQEAKNIFYNALVRLQQEIPDIVRKALNTVEGE